MRKEIHRTLTVEAPIDRVWVALTDRDALSQWYMRTSDFEPVVGSTFLFEDTPQGKWDGKIIGEVLEVDAPNVLAYTFWGNQMKNKSTVRWTLSEKGEQTQIKLDHTGFEGFGDWLIGNIIAFGWRKLLGQLQQHVGVVRV